MRSDSVTTPALSGDTKTPGSLLTRLTSAAAAESYPVLLVSGAAILMLLGVGFFVTPDTWLALVSGRVVAESGPPSTDTLMAWTSGREWIDQQWLGQLAVYELWRAGGLGLVGLVHVAVVIATFALIVVASRRRGGSPRHVALVGLLAVLPIAIVAGNIRTQTFAIALFGLLLWLLSEDSRAPSRRVLWCLPLLVLWANVHGSVVLGAGLVTLAATLHVARGARARTTGPAVHGASLFALTAVALLCTPYGFSLFSYLADVFGNSEIAAIAPEWMPTALEPAHVPFYMLGALTLVLLGRQRGELTAFEQLALVLLLAGALSAERNLAWFALAALLLTPPLLASGGERDSARPPVGLAAAVSASAAVAVVVAAIVGVGNVEQQVGSRFPDAAAAVVAEATQRDASLDVLAHPRYSDWLIFRQPSLKGRVAFDIRYELLTAAELRRFRRMRYQIGADWLAALGSTRLLVLDTSEKPLDELPSTARVLLRQPTSRQLYAGNDISVILRTTSSGSAP